MSLYWRSSSNLTSDLVITQSTDDISVGLNNFFFTLQGLQKEFAMTVFHGNDVTLTMEFFIYLVEMRSEREGLNKRTMIKVLMNMIPDSKSDAQEDAILPSTVWKEIILSSSNDSLSGQSWNEIKKDINSWCLDPKASTA